jgi:fluoride exporter
MSPSLLMSVALGGAVGAVGRFLVTSAAGHWFGHGFPIGTMIVNILGSFVLGALIEVFALVWSPGEEVRAFLIIGMLGAFTTFSSFSIDTVTLIDRGNYLLAGGYVGGSIIISVFAFISGMAAFRQVLS